LGTNETTVNPTNPVAELLKKESADLGAYIGKVLL